MGTPIICPRCNTKNGLLEEECRQCGAAISRSGIISRKRDRNGWVPSAAWETDPISDIWRNTTPQIEQAEPLDVHDFLKYTLILKSIGRQFARDDDSIWFDDALFFLRGGYAFFCHLNQTTNMTLRGRILGGLNHGKRPKTRVQAWLSKLIDEAVARDVTRLDILVCEEVNSGSAAHQLVNLINNHLKSQTRTPIIDLRFHFYLVCGDSSELDLDSFAKAVARKRRYRINALQVTNEFRVFRGQLLTYDNEKFSGLKVASLNSAAIESYTAIRYQNPCLNIKCPQTNELIFPGDDDFADVIGLFAVYLLKGDKDDFVYRKFEQNINNSCDECKKLFKLLCSDEDGWASHSLFGAPFDECVKTRSYFLWENRNGKAWWDPFMNWLEAEAIEKGGRDF